MNLKPIVVQHPNEHLRLTFVDGEIYILKNLYAVEPAVYGTKDQWSGEIIHVVFTKRKGIRTGSGLDFLESEVVLPEIVIDKN
jgi:hypothetical protein